MTCSFMPLRSIRDRLVAGDDLLVGVDDVVNQPCGHRAGQILHRLEIKPVFGQLLFVVEHGHGELLVLLLVSL